MLEVTDGCGKQYRCGNALMFLSVLARKYEIIIDRAVDAPGHGKGVVDGIQGCEKNFIRRKMCTINKNGQESAQNRMEAALISDDTPTSFAKECICLCSAESRTMDVNTHKKNKNEKNVRRYWKGFITTMSTTLHKKSRLKRKQKDLIKAQKLELCPTTTLDLITGLVRGNVPQDEFLVFAPHARSNCRNPGINFFLRANKICLQKIKVVSFGICFRV